MTTPLEKRDWEYEWCKRCNKRNNIGYVVSDETQFNVVGDKNIVLCLSCFDELAQKKGISYLNELKELYFVSFDDDMKIFVEKKGRKESK